MRWPCWHRWKRSKYQFQALGGPTTLTLKCEKCGKIKIVPAPYVEAARHG